MELHNRPEAQRAVHEAVSSYIDEGGLVVGWTLMLDVVAPDGRRCLATRSGGGHDGTEPPTAWTALGMLRSGMQDCEDALSASTIPIDGDEE